MISSAQDLSDFRKRMNGYSSYRSAHVQLTQDIDLSELSDAAGGWTPIGETQSYAFTGVFDGGGFTIRGLEINIESSSHSDVYAGLFGYVNDDTENGGNRGVVKNVNVEDAKINVTVTGSAYTSAGIIAGRCGGDISGCTSSGSVNVTAAASYRVGGIVGYIQNYGDVTDCENRASIQVTETGNDYIYANVGGIAGYAANVNNIVNCTNGRTVTGGASSSAGGIAGYFDYNWNYYGDKNAYKAVTLNGCENSGEVTGNRAGGIAGQISNDVDEAALVRLTNCTNSGEVKGIGDGSYAGGIVGYIYDDSAVKLVSSSTTGTITGDSETATCGGIAGCLASGAAITADPATTWDKTSNSTLTEIGSDPNYTTGATAQGGGLITEHIITATAYEGGTISPDGEVDVTEGGSQSFTITANEGYLIDYLLIDGAVDSGLSGQSTGAYTFSDVREAHTIKAYFRQDGSTTPDDDVTGEVTASEGSTITDMSSTNLSDEESKNAMANASQSGENITPLGAFTLNVTHNGGPAEFVVHLHKELTFTGTPVVIIERKDKSAYTIFDATYANKTISFRVDELKDYFSSNTVVIADKTSAPGGGSADNDTNTNTGGGGGGGCSAGFGALALLALVPLALKRRK